MTYTKQTWSDNNPSYPGSAARFTHMEDGILNASVTKEAPVNVQHPDFGALGNNSHDDSAAINYSSPPGYTRQQLD